MRLTNVQSRHPQVSSVLNAEVRQQDPQVQQQSASQSWSAAPSSQPQTTVPSHDRSLAAEHHDDPCHNTHPQADGEDTFFDAEEGKACIRTFQAGRDLGLRVATASSNQLYRALQRLPCRDCAAGGHKQFARAHSYLGTILRPQTIL